MKISVLINNYNYQDYVLNAIESVLNQSVLVDQIIVVDDCSTDQSAHRLKERFENSDLVKLILKQQNEGQLAAFQAGFDASIGDIICFLDADDLYHEKYVETILEFYQNHPDCEFLFTCAEIFGDESRIASRYDRTRSLGQSRISTLYQRSWIGHRTSTLSMRRFVLDKILPIPYLEDWRIRADDCLTYGSSIVGAHKYYLAEPLVRYRVHGSNGHYGRSKTRSKDYFQQYEAALDRLFQFWIDKYQYPKDLDQFAHIEFKSIEQPLQNELETVRSLIRGAAVSKPRKLLMLLSAYLHFFRHGISSCCSLKN